MYSISNNEVANEDFEVENHKKRWQLEWQMGVTTA